MLKLGTKEKPHAIRKLVLLVLSDSDSEKVAWVKFTATFSRVLELLDPMCKKPKETIADVRTMLAVLRLVELSGSIDGM